LVGPKSYSQFYNSNLKAHNLDFKGIKGKGLEANGCKAYA